MAGDWIKLEHTTPDKPEIVTLAALLKIDQDAVTGKLFRIWAWADQNSLAGNPVAITDAFLDRLTMCAGFAAAMRKVGWLSGKAGSLVFPNFERHNGKTAKERAMSNRRASRFRNGNVTVAPLLKPLPEKRREEYNTGTHTPPGARIPTARSSGAIEELAAHALGIGLPASDGQWCHDKWEGNGWTNKGGPIKDWKATMRSWKAQGFLPSQKAAAGHSPPKKPTAEPTSRPWDKGVQ